MQHKVTYLGYVVTEAGISADPGKVKAVRDKGSETTVLFRSGLLPPEGYTSVFLNSITTVCPYKKGHPLSMEYKLSAYI